MTQDGKAILWEVCRAPGGKACPVYGRFNYTGEGYADALKLLSRVGLDMLSESDGDPDGPESMTVRRILVAPDRVDDYLSDLSLLVC